MSTAHLDWDKSAGMLRVTFWMSRPVPPGEPFGNGSMLWDRTQHLAINGTLTPFKRARGLVTIDTPIKTSDQIEVWLEKRP